jgi:hypothetical protein
LPSHVVIQTLVKPKYGIGHLSCGQDRHYSEKPGFQSIGETFEGGYATPRQVARICENFGVDIEEYLHDVDRAP